MKIEDCRIGQKVYHRGVLATISEIDGKSNSCHLDLAPPFCGRGLSFPVAELNPVDVEDPRVDWCYANTYKVSCPCGRSAIIELEGDSAPLEKAATFAIRVDAGRFLKEATCPSQDVRRICEVLLACGPHFLPEIRSLVGSKETTLLDALIEARERGLIVLEDGKYRVASP